MNKRIGILLGGLCILLLEGGAGRIDKKPALTITPSRLELFVNQHTDPYTIKVSYILNIPYGFIPSCARMVFQPYFLAAGHRYDLTPLVVSGKNNLRQENRLVELTDKQPDSQDALFLLSDGDGMKVRLAETVSFELWMAQAKLRADVTLEACDREKHVEVLTLADGVLWFPMGPGPVRVKYAEEKMTVRKVAEYSFLYPSGQSVFNKSYDGNAWQNQRMVRLVDSLRADSAMSLEKIVITGSASPGGSFPINSGLARQRAERMKQYLVGREFIASGLVELRYVDEDWNGLRELVEQSVMTDKEDILDILDNAGDHAQRENLLRRLPQYEYLRLKFFPELQKVTCTFYYTHREEATKVVPE